jgi:uncharacterized protein with NRDE domain
MCTLVILRRPGHDWPVIIAANRDEMADRPWLPPGRHWPDRPETVGGLDMLAGGSWLAVNQHGVAAGILNRMGSLGPLAGRRSRGELVLEAVDHADARVAAEALSALEPRSYRPFNLIVADDRDAFWLRHADPTGIVPVSARPLPVGLSMITSGDLDDPESARIRDYLPRFRAEPPPDPERGDWSAWQALLASDASDPAAGPRGAMNFTTPDGFATVSSALIALPRLGRPGTHPVFRFAGRRPQSTPWQETKV